MKKSLVAGAVAVAAVFAGVLYFARDAAPPQTPAETPAPRAADPGAPQATRAPVPVSRSVGSSRPAVSDPRLAALMKSPDNELIEFFADAEGRVIREIDNDPNSEGFRKPLREYTYAGNKVIRLVSYKYLGNQVQIIQADVVYRPDGSIDKYQESTRYEHQNRR